LLLVYCIFWLCWHDVITLILHIIHSVIHSFIHLFVRSFVHSFIHFFVHLVIHSFSHIHTYIHSLICKHVLQYFLKLNASINKKETICAWDDLFLSDFDWVWTTWYCIISEKVLKANFYIFMNSVPRLICHLVIQVVCRWKPILWQLAVRSSVELTDQYRVHLWKLFTTGAQFAPVAFCNVCNVM